MILLALIDAVDEAGYLRVDLMDVANRLGIDIEDVQAVLGVLQGFDPVGVGARDLSECLSLQLKAKDRLDPAMEALLTASIWWPAATWASSPPCAAWTPKTLPT